MLLFHYIRKISFAWRPAEAGLALRLCCNVAVQLSVPLVASCCCCCSNTQARPRQGLPYYCATSLLFTKFRLRGLLKSLLLALTKLYFMRNWDIFFPADLQYCKINHVSLGCSIAKWCVLIAVLQISDTFGISMIDNPR